VDQKTYHADVASLADCIFLAEKKERFDQNFPEEGKRM